MELGEFSQEEQLVLLEIEKKIEEIYELHNNTKISLSQLFGIFLVFELKGIIQQNKATGYQMVESLVIQKGHIYFFKTVSV